MLTIVSINAAYHFPKYYRIMMDPLRLPAQIISGVGFIGAGVILRKSNDVISGTDDIGYHLGRGRARSGDRRRLYKEAFASLLFILISVEFLPWLIRKIGPNRLKEKDIRVRMSLSDKDKMTEILKEMKSKQLRIHSVRIDDLGEKEFPIMEVKVSVHKTATPLTSIMILKKFRVSSE